MKYTVGLIFDQDCKNILLLRKNKPSWMIGRLNGIGGKVEGNETALECMIRESKEETTIQDENWQFIGDVCGPDFLVSWFAIYGQDFSKIDARTDERLINVYVAEMFEADWMTLDIMPHVRLFTCLALYNEVKFPVFFGDNS